jgi:hypothetical protein
VLNCRELISCLGDYLDAAPSGNTVEIERHLAACRRCRIVCETTRQTITLYKRVCGPCALPDEVENRLKAALAKHCGKPA